MVHLHKVRSHVGIKGNEVADKLAKNGAKLPMAPTNNDPIHIFHPSPHFLHSKIFRTGPICNLDTFLPLLYKDRLLNKIIPSHPSLQKWAHNDQLDHTLSNLFWTHPLISPSQITQTIKFRT